MSTEKGTLLKSKTAGSGISAQKLLKKTLVHNASAKAADYRQLPAPPPMASALHISVKKKTGRELNASASGVRPVPALHLSQSLHGSVLNSPVTSPRGETANSPRSKPQITTLSPTTGDRIISLNLSIGSPKRSPTAAADPSLSHFFDSHEFPEVAYPISPAQALKLFSSQLSPYEQGEILETLQIYYLGLGANKKNGGSGQLNYGFDDERGDYLLVLTDHIAYRYEVLNLLGKGSFGQVFRCFDHREKQLIALKIIRNKRRFHQQGLVEVRVLEQLRAHDSADRMCVVKLQSHFTFRKHLCLTFELLSSNLYDFLKTNDYAGLSLNLVRRFAIQLVIALRFIRANRVIHCDLKPENILLKQPNKSGIKVIDFGSACFETEKVYTYIQSRYYRAPEVMLGIAYTAGIDMWSLGCILGELYTGRPLFPGESEQEQMMCIMEALGPPPQSLLDQSTRKKLFFDVSNVPKLVTNSRGKKRLPSTKPLQASIRTSDPAFLQFISQCLEWDPSARLTPDAALKHQWIVEGIAKMQQAALVDKRKMSNRGEDSAAGERGERD